MTDEKRIARLVKNGLARIAHEVAIEVGMTTEEVIDAWLSAETYQAMSRAAKAVKRMNEVEGNLDGDER